MVLNVMCNFFYAYHLNFNLVGINTLKKSMPLNSTLFCSNGIKIHRVNDCECQSWNIPATGSINFLSEW